MGTTLAAALAQRVRASTERLSSQGQDASPSEDPFRVSREAATSACCRKALHTLGSNQLRTRLAAEAAEVEEEGELAPGVALALDMARLHAATKRPAAPAAAAATEAALPDGYAGRLAALAALLGSTKQRAVAEQLLMHPGSRSSRGAVLPPPPGQQGGRPLPLRPGSRSILLRSPLPQGAQEEHEGRFPLRPSAQEDEDVELSQRWSELLPATLYALSMQPPPPSPQAAAGPPGGSMQPSPSEAQQAPSDHSSNSGHTADSFEHCGRQASLGGADGRPLGGVDGRPLGGVGSGSDSSGGGDREFRDDRRCRSGASTSPLTGERQSEGVAPNLLPPEERQKHDDDTRAAAAARTCPSSSMHNQTAAAAAALERLLRSSEAQLLVHASQALRARSAAVL